jgi:16S rRNA (cytosine1402-N4)-methyltransferase
LIIERGFYFVTVILAVEHIPVLADEAIRLAAGCRTIVDCTGGGGGHAERFATCAERVLVVDRDPDAVRRLRDRFGDTLAILPGRFGDDAVLEKVAAFRPDFVFMDLGVSSHQLEDGVRGFSFRPGRPLDMRMDLTGPTAADLLNTSSKEALRTIFRDFGDEPRAGALAAEIIRRRGRGALETSDDLVNAIRAVRGARAGPADFARLFQAVRIAVNDESDQLSDALPALRDCLVPGGRMAVLSYHSGEDRTVKHMFREWGRSCVCEAGQPVCTCRGRALGTVLTKRPIVPTPEEVGANPRARSAKLRAFEVSP